MAERLYVLNDVDFEGLDRDLAALRPQRVGVEVVLGKMKDRLAAQRRRGVTPGQMREVLKRYGVTVSENRLARFLDEMARGDGEHEERKKGGTDVEDDSGTARDAAEVAGGSGVGAGEGEDAKAE